MGRWSQARRIGTPSLTLASPPVEPVVILSYDSDGSSVVLQWTANNNPDRWDVYFTDGPGSQLPGSSNPWDSMGVNVAIGNNVGSERLVSYPLAYWPDASVTYAALRYWQGSVASPWVYTGTLA